MMKDAIEAFASQFSFEPKIVNVFSFEPKKRFIVCGMGGSHWAADILLSWDPSLPLIIHNDYGLPALSDEELKDSLIICSTYSGNTEEVLDAYDIAREKGLAVAAISTGALLIEKAEADKVPYIEIPTTGIQPRAALGYSMRAMLKFMGKDGALSEMEKLAESFDPKKFEIQGKELADTLKDKVPVIYCSKRNYGYGANWKIKFNETGKIPAYYNIVPELNHNEANGFDAVDSNRHLINPFHFIFLKDADDHPRNQKRMEVLQKLYEDRGLPVTAIALSGGNAYEKMFNNLILADWAAVHTADIYGLDSENVPLVEEFKKLIA